MKKKIRKKIPPKGKKKSKKSDQIKKESTKEQDNIEVVGFHIGKDSFGVDIRMVSEILRMVEITSVPKSPLFVEGVINIRGRIVPILNLRTLFGLEEKPHTINTEIIVAKIDDKEIGLTIDQVAEIVTTSSDDILPPDKQTVPMARFLIGMITLDQGLMFLIDLKKILDTEKRALLRKIAAGPKTHEESSRATTPAEKILRTRALELSRRKEEKVVAVRQIIAFELGNENYGVDIKKVREISNMRELYYMPSAPQYILGAINLRGDIIAIMDLPKLFGLLPSAPAKKRQIVILDHAIMNVGFIVESVCNIINLPEKEIEPPLATLERSKMDYLEGAAKFKGKLIGMLNVKNIISSLGARNE